APALFPLEGRRAINRIAMSVETPIAAPAAPKSAPVSERSPADRTLQELAALDKRMVAAVKGVKVLSVVSWPMKVQEQFLVDWHRGNARLPEVTYPRCDYRGTRDEIDAIQMVARLYGDHPVADYIWRTAESCA